MAASWGRWTLAAGWLLAVYASAPFARLPVEFLRQRGVLAPTVGGSFGVILVLAVMAAARSRAGWPVWSVLSVGAAIYGLLLSRLELAEERLHFLQYGVLAVLIERALPPDRFRPLARIAIAAALTAAAGWGDELIQAVLPNRVYDLRDVGFNAAAGVIALSLLGAWRWARATDRQEGSDDDVSRARSDG